jgi:hypothetical protein
MAALSLAAGLWMLVLAGCGTAPVSLRYQPSSPPWPPATALAPRVFVAPVIDKTGGPDSFGGDINRQLRLTAGASAEIDPPYVESLEEGLRLELGRMGLSVAREGEEAGAVLETILTKTFAYVKSAAGAFDVPVYAAFEFSLALTCRSGGSPLWADKLNGYGQGLLSAPDYLRVGSGPNDAMNAAFNDALAQIGPKWQAGRVLERLSRQCGGPAR